MVFARFTHCRVTLPTSPIMFSLEGSHYAQPTSKHPALSGGWRRELPLMLCGAWAQGAEAQAEAVIPTPLLAPGASWFRVSYVGDSALLCCDPEVPSSFDNLTLREI